MADPITIDDLTEVKLDGEGAFDKLMQVTRLHLQEEFKTGRIKAPEYAQVLSSSLDAILQNAVIFLLQKDEAANKAALVQAQIELTNAQRDLVLAQIENQQEETELTRAKVTLTLAQATLPPAEIRKIDAQIVSAGITDLYVQAQTVTQAKQTDLVAQQVLKLTQDTTNAAQELKNLIAQECVLKSQFDLNMEQKLNVTAQTGLVSQRSATERAQTIGSGVDVDSVIGRQKALYKAQADGFQRDAEQKTTKILIDSWNVRRTTDSGTVADGTNKLYDPSIGRAVDKLLIGINA